MTTEIVGKECDKANVTDLQIDHAACTTIPGEGLLEQSTKKRSSPRRSFMPVFEEKIHHKRQLTECLKRFHAKTVSDQSLRSETHWMFPAYCSIQILTYYKLLVVARRTHTTPTDCLAAKSRQFNQSPSFVFE
ncbi:hypothetical protein KIN20_001868 [Parelaphostrongylus tenuis]|uniref:Uncharacterized protein n=1 Tax=Parelaphostrongylus tenuis TaxID=148309 RepID=A0AAD5MFR6_PARTN|nr:hypothetical protein KIN20_001868 [Parelaphostrongylus tenuis]